MLTGKVMPCFPVFKDNQGLIQLVAQNPRSRTQIRSTLTYVTICFENFFARGTLQ